MSRRTAVRKIDVAFTENKNKVIEALSKIEFVCTTADIWSAKKRSFFGVTCHWIDTDLKRNSVALCCRRFSGTHSYDKIALTLSEIHSMYELDVNKIVATVTDNSSNLVKSFKEYGIQIQDEIETTGVVSFDDEDEVPNFEECIFDDLPLQTSFLPRHVRCYSYTLNLIAVNDISKAIKANFVLQSRHTSIMSKCSEIWNKAGRPKTAEIIQSVVGHTFSYPCITRWNSLHDSINSISYEKEQYANLAEKLEIKNRLTEIDFEYCNQTSCQHHRYIAG